MKTAQFTNGNIAILALFDDRIFCYLPIKQWTRLFQKPMAKTDPDSRAAGRRAGFDVRAKSWEEKMMRLVSCPKILDKMAGALEESRVSLENETSAKMASQEKFLPIVLKIPFSEFSRSLPGVIW